MQLDYSDTLTPSQKGQVIQRLITDGTKRNSGWALQRFRIHVDTVTNSTTYTWTVVDIWGETHVLTYTSDSSATEAEIQAGIKAKCEENALVAGSVRGIVLDSSGNVDFYGIPGKDFTVSDSDARLTTTEPVPFVTAAVLPFGELAFASSSDFLSVGRAPGLLATSPKSVTAVVIANDATDYEVLLTYHGTTYILGITSGGGATKKSIVDALVIAINGAMPAVAVVAANDGSDNLELHSDVPGDDDWSFSVLDATLWTSVTWGGLTFALLCQGVAEWSGDYETDPDAPGYPAAAPVNLLRKGVIAVPLEDDLSAMDGFLWYGVASTDLGKWRSSVGTTPANWLRLPIANFRLIGQATGGASATVYATVEVNL